jgi:hypothetical protein
MILLDQTCGDAHELARRRSLLMAGLLLWDGGDWEDDHGRIDMGSL